MYLTLLYLHSWLRWLVIFSALWTIGSAISALRRGGASSRGGRVSAKLFTGSLDLQILLGLLLYFLLSPYTPNSFSAFAQSMKVSVLRYFAVEHPFVMVVAAIVAHVTMVRARKAPNERVRQRRILIGVGVAVLLILVGIPWPFLPHARPLLRLS
jgi:hypothetical protein